MNETTSAGSRLHFIDSHTGGEPTRVITQGGPDLGSGSPAERRRRLSEEFDHIRRAVTLEPRGSDILVSALLLPPMDPSAAAGVIFFNNAGTLGMCGHGAIGVIRTLEYMGRIGPGIHTLETPVGSVQAQLDTAGNVTLRNVISRRLRKAVSVEVPGIGSVSGDIAWGGNWFFLIQNHGLELNLSAWRQLTDYTAAVRAALTAAGITGEDGGEIDHIELFGPSAAADSRNFVLCPGLAYDRSPCGTGTSAKLACLAEDGKLAPGQIWRQESITGSIFEAWYEPAEGGILPTIRGTAFVTAEGELILHPMDPLRYGMAPSREGG
jgi:4-hydroxyproline epimerase